MDKASIELFGKKNLSYCDCLLNITITNIYETKRMVKKSFYPLNTSIYFVIDYFGKRHFNEIYKSKELI